MTSILSTLKLVEAKRQNSVNPTIYRRNKLLTKISAQIALAQSMMNGQVLTKKRKKTITDQVTGQSQTVEVDKEIKRWWFDPNGDAKKITVQVFYGNKPLALSTKGDKNGVEVTDIPEVISVLSKIKDAVQVGELDSALEATSKMVRAKFKK